MSVKATVFNIERVSLNDGRGIRTVVYLKGCTMSCRWCHNPEGLSFERQIAYYKNRCVLCGRCIATCPASCYKASEEGIIRDYSLCVQCGVCVEECPTNALAWFGKVMTADEVFHEIMKDKMYFDKSGGGVTFSGGECLVHTDFMFEILSLCKDNGINTLVETSCNVPWGTIERILPVTDEFYVDIKHMSPEIHMEYTTADNKLILENIKKLAQSNAKILIRIPLIPGVNDDEVNLLQTYEFVNLCGLSHIMLLRYNPLGESKYVALDKQFYQPLKKAHTEEEIQNLCNKLNEKVKNPEFFVCD